MFSQDYPWGSWQRSMESDLGLRHQESFPPGNAQIISIQGTPCDGMNRLVMCIYVEQQRVKDLWKVFLLCEPSAVFADEVHTKTGK